MEIILSSSPLNFRSGVGTVLGFPSHGIETATLIKMKLFPSLQEVGSPCSLQKFLLQIPSG